MAAREEQQRIDTPTVPAHLSKRHGDIGGHPRFHTEDLTAREWFCRDCGSRITRSPDGQREYGHGRHCEHRLDRDGDLPGDES